jgi:ABC-type nitrate/sulfonate/bicarbonate transport system substrate-binding protein
LRKWRKWIYTIGIILSLPLPATVWFCRDSLPQKFQPYIDEGHVLLFVLFIWIMTTTLEAWITAAEDSETLREIKESQKLTGKTADDAAVNSKNSLRLLNTITLKLKDYSGLTPIKVSVANFNDFFIYIPFYVAIKFDLFQQEDLHVSVRPQGGDDKAFEALLQTEYHFAITDPSMILNNLAEGRIIAPLVTKAALWGVSSEPILDRKQISSVATYAEPSTAFRLAQHWLSHNGNTSAKIVSCDTDAFVSDVDSLLDKHNLICVTEPERSWLYKKRPDLQAHEIDFHSDLYKEGQFNFSAVLSTAKEIKFNREVVKRFLKALRLAYNLVYSARKGTTTYEKIINAAQDYCINTYPFALSSEIDFTTCEAILERLRERNYFSRTIVYNSEQKRGLIQSFKLRETELPNGTNAQKFADDYVVDAEHEFQLTV